MAHNHETTRQGKVVNPTIPMIEYTYETIINPPGSIHRKYERGDESCYSIIRSKIADLWEYD